MHNNNTAYTNWKPLRMALHGVGTVYKTAPEAYRKQNNLQLIPVIRVHVCVPVDTNTRIAAAYLVSVNYFCYVPQLYSVFGKSTDFWTSNFKNMKKHPTLFWTRFLYIFLLLRKPSFWHRQKHFSWIPGFRESSRTCASWCYCVAGNCVAGSCG